MFVALQYYNDYGDIIKATLGKAREINKTNCARTMAISLTMLFRELQRDGTRINRQSEDFVSLKVRLLLFTVLSECCISLNFPLPTNLCIKSEYSHFH
jgi:hypothetical protein